MTGEHALRAPSPLWGEGWGEGAQELSLQDQFPLTRAFGATSPRWGEVERATRPSPCFAAARATRQR
jgi:hypothetical protein